MSLIKLENSLLSKSKFNLLIIVLELLVKCLTVTNLPPYFWTCLISLNKFLSLKFLSSLVLYSKNLVLLLK